MGLQQIVQQIKEIFTYHKPEKQPIAEWDELVENKDLVIQTIWHGPIPFARIIRITVEDGRVTFYYYCPACPDNYECRNIHAVQRVQLMTTTQQVSCSCCGTAYRSFAPK